MEIEKYYLAGYNSKAWRCLCDCGSKCYRTCCTKFSGLQTTLAESSFVHIYLYVYVHVRLHLHDKWDCDEI